MISSILFWAILTILFGKLTIHFLCLLPEIIGVWTIPCLIFTVLFGMVTWFCIDENKKTKKYPYLKWKTLRDLYRINPNRWGTDNHAEIIYRTNDGQWQPIIVSFWTLCLTSYYTAKKNKQKQKKQCNEALESIIETAQNDIANLRKKSKDQINEGITTTMEVINRL